MIIHTAFSILLVTISVNLAYVIDPKSIQGLLEDIELPKNITNKQLEQFEDFKSFVDKKNKQDEAKKDLQDTWNKVRYAVNIASAGDLDLDKTDAKKVKAFIEEILNSETNEEAKTLIIKQIPQIEDMLIPEGERSFEEKNAEYMICYYSILHDIFRSDIKLGELSIGDKKMLKLSDRIMEEFDDPVKSKILATTCN